MPDSAERVCSECGGSGHFTNIDEDCKTCNGTGLKAMTESTKVTEPFDGVDPYEVIQSVGLHPEWFRIIGPKEELVLDDFHNVFIANQVCKTLNKISYSRAAEVAALKAEAERYRKALELAVAKCNECKKPCYIYVEEEGWYCGKECYAKTCGFEPDEVDVDFESHGDMRQAVETLSALSPVQPGKGGPWSKLKPILRRTCKKSHSGYHLEFFGKCFYCGIYPEDKTLNRWSRKTKRKHK